MKTPIPAIEKVIAEKNKFIRRKHQHKAVLGIQTQP